MRNQVGNKLEMEFLDQGEKTVKNIAQPVHVYFINLGYCRASGAAQQQQPVSRGPAPTSRRWRSCRFPT